MIPAAFAYQRVATIDEALAIIGSDPGAKVLAGGQSLIPLLKLRLGSVETLVDIGRVPGLRGVRQLDDGRLAIGALTTYAELLESPAKDYGVTAGCPAAYRRRPGPQPRDDRGRHRPRRPGLGPARLPARARCRAGHPLGERRADDPDRRVLRGRIHDRPRTGRDPDRDPAAGPARRRRVRLRDAPAAGLRLCPDRCRSGRLLERIRWDRGSRTSR